MRNFVAQSEKPGVDERLRATPVTGPVSRAHGVAGAVRLSVLARDVSVGEVDADPAVQSLVIEERAGGLLAARFHAMASPCELLLPTIDRAGATVAARNVEQWSALDFAASAGAHADLYSGWPDIAVAAARSFGDIVAQLHGG